MARLCHFLHVSWAISVSLVSLCLGFVTSCVILYKSSLKFSFLICEMRFGYPDTLFSYMEMKTNTASKAETF